MVVETNSGRAKAEATLKFFGFKKGRRLRQKRELLDAPLSVPEDVEKIFSKVGHLKGWAKVGPGSVKLVKRTNPQV